MTGSRGRSDSRLEINATAASLLGFLAAGPLSGYSLAARIETTIGNFWNVTRSQIYRELRTLESAGYVRVGKTGTRDRRPFSLTPLGREAFDDWISREPSEEHIRFPLLLTMYFGDHVVPSELARILREARSTHVTRLNRFRGRLEALRETAPFPAHVARYACLYEEMVLAWFDSLEAEGLL